MRINTNVASLVAQENAANTQFKIGSSLEKLSSGLKINKAADDASGLAIADKLRTQGTSIDQGIANGNSAVTLLQIADKSMSEQSNILDTIKAKLIQANTDTTSDDGRESIRKDISKLLEQLDNIAEQTNYNGNVLLQSAAGDSATDKAASADLNFQIGESKNDVISNTSVQSNTDGLGSKVSFVANTTLAASTTTTVAGSDAISLTSTIAGANTSESVTLSGDVDTLELVAGMTVTGLDAASKALLDTPANAASFTKTGADTFNITGSISLDLSTVDSVAATIVTTAEAASTYTPAAGDVLTINASNASSALSTALADNSKFLANTDGTYTATAAASALVLEFGESIDSVSNSTATTANQLSYSTGDVVTSGTVIENSALHQALQGANFTDNNDGTYTAAANSTVRLAATENVTATNTATAIITAGDVVDTSGGTVVTGSALDLALSDTTKFDQIGTSNQYRALVDGNIALAATESTKVTDSTLVSFGPALGAGSTITLTSDAVSSGALFNELQNTSKFTLTGTGGVSGDIYTAVVDFVTPDILLSSGESFDIAAAAALTTTDITSLRGAGSADADITFEDMAGTPEAGTFYDSGAGTVHKGASGGDPVFTTGTEGHMVIDLTSTASGDTVNIATGDIVTVGTDTADSGGVTMAQLIATSADFQEIDNSGTFAYTGAGVALSMGAAANTLEIQRYVAPGAASTHANANTATDYATTSSVTGASDGSANTAADATVAVTFNTGSTVDITNNASATDTLTMSSTGDINNGKLQLSALAALDEGELTKELADSFQSVVDDAITVLNGYRGDVGSTQNQVESAVRNLMTQSTNVKAAESIIRDVDYAQESANFNKQNIISQAGTYAMSQANSAAQNVLRLLQ